MNNPPLSRKLRKYILRNLKNKKCRREDKSHPWSKKSSDVMFATVTSAQELRNGISDNATIKSEAKSWLRNSKFRPEIFSRPKSLSRSKINSHHSKRSWKMSKKGTRSLWLLRNFKRGLTSTIENDFALLRVRKHLGLIIKTRKLKCQQKNWSNLWKSK